jgi:hypothetical protein
LSLGEHDLHSEGILSERKLLFLIVNGRRLNTIDISANGGTSRADNARVIKTDIAASNGVIHVIDTVIVPDGSK